MNILSVLLGSVLLLAGKKLFWLFVGIAGFAWGVELVSWYFAGCQKWVIFLTALLFGLAGVFFAIFMQRFAIAAGGFFAGGYIIAAVMYYLGFGTVKSWWIYFVIGGIAGGILLSLLFDPALIIISSVLGALLIVRIIPLSILFNSILFILLTVAGIFIQIRFFIGKSTL